MEGVSDSRTDKAELEWMFTTLLFSLINFRFNWQMTLVSRVKGTTLQRGLWFIQESFPCNAGLAMSEGVKAYLAWMVSWWLMSYADIGGRAYSTLTVRFALSHRRITVALLMMSLLGSNLRSMWVLRAWGIRHGWRNRMREVPQFRINFGQLHTSNKRVLHLDNTVGCEDGCHKKGPHRPQYLCIILECKHNIRSKTSLSR